MSNLATAFNFLLTFKSRTITYKRPSSPTNVSGSCKMALANFGRNFEQEQGTVVHGYEVVISKEELSKIPLLNPVFPKRGDRIIDAEFGNLTVDDVTPMTVEGGVLVGWRIRTS